MKKLVEVLFVVTRFVMVAESAVRVFVSMSWAVVEPVRDRLFNSVIVVEETTPFTVEVILFPVVVE